MGIVIFAGWKLNQLDQLNQLDHWTKFICIAMDKNLMFYYKLTLLLQYCKVA